MANGHFHPTTMETVLAHSGPLWKMPRRHKRYVVWATYGFGVTQRYGGTTTGKAAATWAVLDSADCFRDVDRFVPFGGSTDDERYRKAQALADELNDKDRVAA